MYSRDEINKSEGSNVRVALALTVCWCEWEAATVITVAYSLFFLLINNKVWACPSIRRPLIRQVSAISKFHSNSLPFQTYLSSWAVSPNVNCILLLLLLEKEKQKWKIQPPLFFAPVMQQEQKQHKIIRRAWHSGCQNRERHTLTFSTISPPRNSQVTAHYCVLQLFNCSSRSRVELFSLKRRNILTHKGLADLLTHKAICVCADEAYFSAAVREKRKGDRETVRIRKRERERAIVIFLFFLQVTCGHVSNWHSVCLIRWNNVIPLLQLLLCRVVCFLCSRRQALSF